MHNNSNSSKKENEKMKKEEKLEKEDKEYFYINCVYNFL